VNSAPDFSAFIYALADAAGLGNNYLGASGVTPPLAEILDAVVKLRSSATARDRQYEALQSLPSYKAGEISPYSDVYLVADMRIAVAKGETK